ncbi:MAG: hypothetical protein NVSMB2_08850 [Chloroflexota bacterium]
MTSAEPPNTYVVVCRGPHCRHNGSAPLRKRLAQLLRCQPRAQLVGYNCFGQCDDGPNVAFFPEAEWYGGLRPRDAEQLVAHAVSGTPVDAEHLSLSEADYRRHTRNIKELIDTLERDRASQVGRRHWFWPFRARSSATAHR